MKYNLLGKTGLTVSRLSFGASSLGGVFHPVDESEAIRSVHAALVEVRSLLAPVMNKQWDYTAAVDRLKPSSYAVSSPVTTAIPLGACEVPHSVSNQTEGA